MRVRPGLIAWAVVAAAGPAQAQLAPMQPGLTQTAPSTPTPSQPLVAPGLPSRPDQTLAPGTAWPIAPATSPVAPSAPATGRTVRLEQHQTHPSGVIMSLDSITFRADSIIVSATILNPSSRPTWLNRGGSLTLIDDRGRGYPFLPPGDNPEVQIAPQSRVTASFVFAGPVSPDSRTVQLSTNGPSGDRNNRLTSAPSFLFRVPVS
jgi:hypothetical protein